jgi:hypothetical protein
MASEGLRALIARANNDKDFLRQLLTSPEDAVKTGGFELSTEEMQAVRSQYQGKLTDEQLENRVSKAWFRVGP